MYIYKYTLQYLKVGLISAEFKASSLLHLWFEFKSSKNMQGNFGCASHSEWYISASQSSHNSDPSSERQRWPNGTSNREGSKSQNLWDLLQKSQVLSYKSGPGFLINSRSFSSDIKRCLEFFKSMSWSSDCGSFDLSERYHVMINARLPFKQKLWLRIS